MTYDEVALPLHTLQSPALLGPLHTLHFAPRTPHFTLLGPLHTLHFTPRTPHFTLHT